ncbi:DUF4129 domain-containing protein [Paradesertivirga mongoliensis]|uniref:DUF4129 domain-containing protein n=2 Tax=Paradesertivirga mongoliensis TaxID=2100740 RepID=A0ABW4ZID1_9SPHI
MRNLSTSILYLLALTMPFPVFSQRKSASAIEGSVTLRNFDSNAIKEYRLNKEFNYGEVQPDISPSWWDQFWDWFWSLFKETVTNSGTGTFLQYLMIGLGIAALIFLIIKLSGMDLAHLFTGKSTEIEVPYAESLENIHQISFEEELDRALKNNDLRLAVRLLYLRTLKTLNSRGRIKWELDKTNSHYIQELQNPIHKEEFRRLTHRFEYIWYGSFRIDAPLYEKINRSFQDFNATL